jgi:hypothetical protein
VTSILRIAGIDSRADGSLRLRFIFADPDVLQEREGDHGEHGVVMQAVPSPISKGLTPPPACASSSVGIRPLGFSVR